MFSKTFNLICVGKTVSPTFVLSRNYAFKTDLKTKWIKPAKISCIKPVKSGDLSPFESPEQKRLLLNFEKSEELKTADDIVKNMFTLEQNRRCDAVETFKKETVDLVKRHELDLGSIESKIADMTAQIRAMQQYMDEYPRNSVVKVQLKELIDKRKKFLRYLRVWDYKKFEWILERLNIIFRPYPEHFHWITRKESLKKLCKIHCDNVRQERLDAYKKELESKQITFLEDKIKNLDFIRNEQIECRVPVTVNVEEINAIKKQLATLKEKRTEEEKINKQLIAKDDYELNL